MTADAKLLADEIENKPFQWPFSAAEKALIVDALRRYVHAPAGWKLVPIEPTEEMLLAIENGGDVDGEGQTWMEIARIDYAHLLKHIPEFISNGD